MLSVLACRPQLFRLNKLLEPTKLNLLLPKQNLNRTQLQSFKTRRNGQGLDTRPESTLRQWLNSRLFRASASAIGGSAVFFAASAVWSYEKIRSKRDAELMNRRNLFLQRKKEFTSGWDSFPDWQKLAFSIIALNLAVFAAWRVPQLEPIMHRFFTLTINKTNPTFLPMLLSTFSHHSPSHLFVNMFCLYSFIAPLTYSMGMERTLALYLSAGMFSSLLSTIVKLRLGSLTPSLGASGAILGLVGCMCVLQPDSRISILFLPMISFTAQNALLGILALDLTGLVLGWKLFDHAGHLGGTLFGIWYSTMGHKFTDKYRKKVAEMYHKALRSPPKK